MEVDLKDKALILVREEVNASCEGCFFIRKKAFYEAGFISCAKPNEYNKSCISDSGKGLIFKEVVKKFNRRSLKNE